MGKKSGLPKDWINCPENGCNLIASKFMALKTPLSRAYDGKIPEEKRYHPEEIFKRARKNGVMFGLWIDLTMTDRYYNREDIEQMGCEYVKFAIQGHGECPSRKEVGRFVQLVDNFICKNPDKCIAVHCTHGFNRTGFLIASFLVERLRYNVGEAVEMFVRGRPPGIYRANYVRELFRRYGNVANLPPPPPTPFWIKDKR